MKMKKAEANWIIVSAVLALAVLLAYMLISGGVFSKFLNNIGWITGEQGVKMQCTAGPDDTDKDNDGYIDNKLVCVDKKQYACDPDDSDPEKNYGTSDKKSTGSCTK